MQAINLSSAVSSMLRLSVDFSSPTHKHQHDLNIERGEGANVLVCYNICGRDCRLKVKRAVSRHLGGIPVGSK